MSAEPGLDLSGRWTGFYNLPIDTPPTQFELELRDLGGLLSGLTSEEGDTPDCYGLILHAVIEGRREGAAVRFTKTYDYLERAPDVVHYHGTIQPGGDEIEGEWTIPGDWSGTFLMIRNGQAEQEEERQASENV